MTGDIVYAPIEVAIALSLYHYNVAPMERASKVYSFFQGNCLELGELAAIMKKSPATIATELPYPSAAVYVANAMERYGDEARNRADLNAGAWQQFDPTTYERLNAK